MSGVGVSTSGGITSMWAGPSLSFGAPLMAPQTGIPAPSNLPALQAQFPNQNQWVGGTMNSQVLNNPIVQAQNAARQTSAIQQQVNIQVAQQIAKSGSVTTSPTIRAPSGSAITRN